MRFRDLDRDRLERGVRAALEPALRERAAALAARLVAPEQAVRATADAVGAQLR